MKTPILFSLIFLMPGYALHAQEIKVVCDIEAGTMKTFLGTKEVFNPTVKRGQVLSVEIAGYNNYIYDIEVTETVEKTANSGEGFFKGFEALNLGNVLGILQDSDGLVNGETVDAQSVELDLSESTEVRILKKRAKGILSSLKTLDYNLSETETKAEELVFDRSIRANAYSEFQKLKYNPNLPVSKIKKMGNSLFDRALDSERMGELEYSDVLERFEERKAFSKLHKTVVKEHVNYKQALEELSVVNADLEGKSVAKSDPLFFQMKLALSSSQIVDSKYQQVETQLLALDQEAQKDKLEDLVQLWLEREALKSNTFTKKHTTRANGDAMTFDIKFIMKDSVDAPGAKRAFTLPAVRVPVYGSLKINTSLGVVFGQYFDPAKSYFLRDDIIEQENGDAFLPIITSFMHFYRQGKGSTSLGGSIGLGIAAAGGDTNIQSLTFFIGPSLMLGSSERIVISGGIMGGRPERLSSAYQVGDVFSSSLDTLPLRRVYELGYFLGISYNLKNN